MNKLILPSGDEIILTSNTVEEYCSCCDNEVEIKCTFTEKQFCPICNEPIKPCSLCIDCTGRC